MKEKDTRKQFAAHAKAEIGEGWAEECERIGRLFASSDSHKMKPYECDDAKVERLMNATDEEILIYTRLEYGEERMKEVGIVRNLIKQAVIEARTARIINKA